MCIRDSLKDEGAATYLQRMHQGPVNDTDIFHGSQLLLFGFFLRKIGAVQRFQPMPHPLDAHAFPPRGFHQTAAVQTVADQKSLLFIREEKQVVQQQSCPKCIKGVVRRRMRSPVSYTHLDVYKRQPVASSFAIYFLKLMVPFLPLQQDQDAEFTC